MELEKILIKIKMFFDQGNLMQSSKQCTFLIFSETTSFLINKSFCLLLCLSLPLKLYKVSGVELSLSEQSRQMSFSVENV